ncbi:SpoIIE family protein phosphatase [Aeromicrobium sp. IC_218]|uniref:SpoIIE family protein phosphatase n=1 Tax=Aeromicrobium sp. IC_218 TaxID=2545468 RepID=UPI00103EEEEE|nr:SpoIIE family protein phosphatase [Aeromicrobium sp. IC_218]TCJ00689.1 PAS domain S-box protein [Aeromicrobium sp. IC_218]
MTSPEDRSRRSLLTGTASDLDHRLWEVAVGAAGVGVFVWDLESRQLRWDGSLLEIFGLDDATFDGSIDTFFASVHPEDRERVSAALEKAIDALGAYEAEYRINTPAGELRWITARGIVVPGPEGRPAHLLGAAFDSTAERDEDARVTQVLEAMPMAFFSLDREWRFTYANPVAQRLLGAVSLDVVGSVIWELFPAAVGSDFEKAYREAMETQRPVMFEAYYPPPLDDWYEVRAWPTPNGLSVYFLDITERRRLQEELVRSSRVSSLLADITGALNETMEAEEAVAVLAELVAPTLADWCIVTLVEGEGALATSHWRERLRDLATWHGDPARRALVERYAEVRISALSDESFVRRGLESLDPVVLESQAEEAVGVGLQSDEARRVLAELAPESAVAVPLRGRGRTVGLLTAYRSADRPTFGDEDLDVLREVAARAGLALDNARVFAEQRKLSEALQRSLLTDPPEPDHLHVSVRYEPAAEGAEVGGDWYDSFIQEDGATNVVIGDVVGHDTAAATAMGQLRGLLRGIAITTGEGPAEVLRRVDSAMQLLQIETTATVVAARFEQLADQRAEGVVSLRWSSAGHPPPLVAVVRDPDHPAQGVDVAEVGPGSALDVDAHELDQDPDVLLGLDPRSPRHEAVVTLPRGATVLFYTDGLVERRGEDIDAGIERLRRAFADVVGRGLAADLACDAILRELRPDVPEDDVALVMVRLHREDKPRPPEAGPQRTPPGLNPS